jgi:hypothetical protein
MTAKMSAARRAAFLKALGKTGNYAVASEQAGVSRNWVLKARREEPAFDAACREAVAAVNARLRAAGAGRSGSWGHLDGMQLVVRGTHGRRVQIGRARAHQWGPRTEDRFLAVLAATCNVKAAIAAAGMSKGSAYSHRKRWPDFARRWKEAVEEGHVRLELALLENGANLFSRADLPPDVPITGMTAAQAIHVLHMHKKEARGIGKAPGVRWAAAADARAACAGDHAQVFDRGGGRERGRAGQGAGGGGLCAAAAGRGWGRLSGAAALRAWWRRPPSTMLRMVPLPIPGRSWLAVGERR